MSVQKGDLRERELHSSQMSPAANHHHFEGGSCFIFGSYEKKNLACEKGREDGQGRASLGTHPDWVFSGNKENNMPFAPVRL